MDKNALEEPRRTKNEAQKLKFTVGVVAGIERQLLGAEALEAEGDSGITGLECDAQAGSGTLEEGMCRRLIRLAREGVEEATC